MKVGFRTPSVKRSISALTMGQAKRAIKRALIPGYGKRGMDTCIPRKPCIFTLSRMRMPGGRTL